MRKRESHRTKQMKVLDFSYCAHEPFMVKRIGKAKVNDFDIALRVQKQIFRF